MGNPGRFTDFAVARFLSTMDNCWVSLHFADPDVSGAYASEVFGGSYERERCDFGAVTGRGMRALTSLRFSGLTPVTLTHVGGWDNRDSGNMLFSAPLEKPFRVQGGGTFHLPSGMLVLSWD